ncbi:hypothetical protein FHU38_002818 [Saccharomonospora amisosensis]|uniref:Uncharacterized protein n=1 Tax=Saccharomonospora amisosensis TaxID=1128677 RepID=A0A7X5ZR39_9PSEU|nr:hypothetical protein [Saccharomonospora amisosensis]
MPPLTDEVDRFDVSLAPMGCDTSDDQRDAERCRRRGPLPQQPDPDDGGSGR